MRATFHLVPAEVWATADPTAPYAPASLATEGFVHCTDGELELVRTADRHYLADPRPFLALVLDLDLIRARWTLADPAAIYPHIHGPVDRDAIVAVAPLLRSDDGAFLGMGPVGSPTRSSLTPQRPM